MSKKVTINNKAEWDQFCINNDIHVPEPDDYPCTILYDGSNVITYWYNCDDLFSFFDSLKNLKEEGNNL